MMFHKHVGPKDAWLVLSAITTGGALAFTFTANVPWENKVVVLGLGLILALAHLLAWYWARNRKTVVEHVVVMKKTVVIDVGGSAEILFDPPAAIIHPKLVMTAHGRPVTVEDVWRGDVSALAAPKAIQHWHQGVLCAGHVGVDQPIRILLRNEGFAAATVHASIVVPKE